MPDQPDNPRDYDMRIPPPETEHSKHEHHGEEPARIDEGRKDDTAKERKGEFRPEIGQHPER